ncbi:CMRF35-like molecule 2 [Pluvialis apricaria]
MAQASLSMWLLLLLTWMLLPGCLAVKGPSTVKGFLGRSLSVNCKYRHGDEMKPKFWCKLGTHSNCAADIVITLKNQSVVQRDRFSITDNRTQQIFTVTMEGLAEGDAGTYRCGVRKGTTQRDESHRVKVIVSPAPMLSPAPAHPPTVDAALGAPGPFCCFPVLAGLQLLALLAMSGAVLWVSLRGG